MRRSEPLVQLNGQLEAELDQTMMDALWVLAHSGDDARERFDRAVRNNPDFIMDYVESVDMGGAEQGLRAGSRLRLRRVATEINSRLRVESVDALLGDVVSKMARVAETSGSEAAHRRLAVTEATRAMFAADANAGAAGDDTPASARLLTASDARLMGYSVDHMDRRFRRRRTAAYTLAGIGTLTLGIFDPAKIADEGTKGYNQKNNDKLKAKLGGDAANFGEVRFIETSPSEPSFGAPGSADLVVTFRNVHNWTMDGNDAAMFKAFFDVLKPGGTLGVEEHRANPGTDAKTSADTGYLTEEYVIGLATAAGFELVEKSEINANPKDTKDHEKGVWTLPPTLALGDKDKDKYLAIGESDRMTLKFRKPGGDSVAPPAAADGAATGTDTPKGFEAGKQAEGETPAAAETPAG